MLTPRFELRLASRLDMFRLKRRAFADPDLRAMLLLTPDQPSAWRILRRARRYNGRTRFGYAIIDRKTGEAIGYHTMALINYRTATPEVAIFDRRWWGTGAVIEIRKALFPAFFDHAGIRHFSAQVHSRNFASLLNHRKMGLEQTGTIRMARYDYVRDEPADYVTMAIYGEKLAEKIEEWSHDDG